MIKNINDNNLEKDNKLLVLQNKIKSKMIEIDIKIHKIDKIQSDEDDKILYDLFNEKHKYLLINNFINNLFHFKTIKELENILKDNDLSDDYLKDPEVVISCLINNL